ncbi:MAG: 3-hydroxyacyl-CoA dehydrogenase/enoyl-CoA hydratase/3-hydroxybutyryl-CoA epimerase [Enterobacterales bacterium]|jgi:3-hydroxyacyl-CoA dehydrogenase/enoyl-CoA hydratase/3-hydroxybutyryl-CoA epimerase
MNNTKSLRFEILDDNIALITIDLVGEKQNSLRAEFSDEFSNIFDQLEKTSVSGIIITSGKKDSFIVGADINVLSQLKTKEQILELTSAGYEIFNKIENFHIPVVAEIHGACLGGGLELTLACHGRVCSKHASTILALPEVQLGLLPGGGGTQRLPKLIGITEALGMMTTGRNIRPSKALKMGLVDDLAEPIHLRTASLKLLRRLAQKTDADKDDSASIMMRSLLTLKGWQSLLLEKNQLGLDFLFQQARKKVKAKTKGNYPAPELIIDCVEDWASGDQHKGYETEAKNFAELVLSPEAEQLIKLFFAVTDLKKDNFVDLAVQSKAVNKLGILGGGLMGAGIALVSADKANTTVRIKDLEEQGVNHALKYAHDRLQEKVKKRHYSKQQAIDIMAKLSGTTDYSGFGNVDMVIEAVFESLELKHSMLKEVEKNCPKDTIFASNTSSIPITDIAAKAKRPENVIGMHYFSPVEKMPLLELIVTKKTSQEVIATAVKYGRKQGKTVIVVNDGAGFYTSRVLAAYMNEAGHLVSEGVPVEDIDSAMTSFGYPVGPITLLDEVGIDVGTKITPILEQAFGKRMTPASAFSKLTESGREGRKNKKGFYDYENKTKGKRAVDETVYTDIGVKPTNKMDPEVISERCNLMLINECIRCLGEGILQSPRDGDIGAIFGLGYPPFLGGPFRYSDKLGLHKLIERLEYFEKNIDQRFKPCQYLVDMVNKDKTFY